MVYLASIATAGLRAKTTIFRHSRVLTGERVTGGPKSSHL
jgi:hypothetical protein